MVSRLAKDDFEDLRAEGLNPTLEDFDRLNQLALRLTDGAETTAANFPRIGWAGDVPFHQPTCAAFAWYLAFVDRARFDPATKDSCWFYALAHARKRGAFDSLESPDEIKAAVDAWLSSLPVARCEIARACKYAAVGFDDAQPGRTDAARNVDEAKGEDGKRDESLGVLDATVANAAALTGIVPDALERETPSRLKRMVEAVRNANPIGGHVDANGERSRLTADYQLAFREIKTRLLAERAQNRIDSGADGADRGRDAVHDERGDDAGAKDGEAKPFDESHGGE